MEINGTQLARSASNTCRFGPTYPRSEQPELMAASHEELECRSIMLFSPSQLSTIALTVCECRADDASRPVRSHVKMSQRGVVAAPPKLRSTDLLQLSRLHLLELTSSRSCNHEPLTTPPPPWTTDDDEKTANI